MRKKSIIEPIKPQVLLICPVCGKEFEPNDDTKYIVKGGYTCSWKCFLKEVADKQGIKNKENNKK